MLLLLFTCQHPLQPLATTAMVAAMAATAAPAPLALPAPRAPRVTRVLLVPRVLRAPVAAPRETREPLVRHKCCCACVLQPCVACSTALPAHCRSEARAFSCDCDQMLAASLAPYVCSHTH